MQQRTRLQIPETEVSAPAGSDQNRGEFGMEMHLNNRRRDRGRFVAVENELDGAVLRVPDLNIDVEDGLLLLGAFEPRRRNDEAIVRTPHAAAELHSRPALREVYARSPHALPLMSPCSTVFSHTAKSALHRHRQAFPSVSDAVTRS